MQRFILAAVITVVLGAWPAHGGADPELLKEFTGLYKAWDNALVKGDAQGQNALLADSFIGTGRDGDTFTKQQAAKGLESGHEKFSTSSTEALDVRLNGNTAIVTGRWVAAGTSEGKTWGGPHRFTDTWMKQDGRWLCLASQVAKFESNVPGEPGAKPGPQQQALAKIAGKWEIKGTIFQNPTGASGKFTRVEDDRMICEGWFLETRGYNQGPDRLSSSVEILAWDPDKSHYQDSYFNNDGAFDRGWKNENAIATVDGNTWHWTWKEEKDGKSYPMKQTVVYADDVQSFTIETWYSEDGQTWKKRENSIGRKIGDAPPEPTSATMQIERATAKWAEGWNQRDAAAVAAIYCKDAELLAPEHPVCKGRAEIQKYLEQDIKENPNVTTAIQSLEVQELGNMAWQVSSYNDKKDGQKIRSGKGITVWQLEDGVWKIARDTWNEDGK